MAVVNRIVAKLRSIKDQDGFDLSDSEFTELCRLVNQGDVLKLSSFLTTLNISHRKEIGKSVLCPTTNAKNAIRPSPFILAARHGKEDMVRYFLKRFSRCDGINYAGTLASSEEFIVDPDSVPGYPSFATLRHPIVSRITAVNAACCVPGQSNIVAILLKAGASSEIADCCGYTPLSSAAACGDLDTVQLLVKQGAKIGHLTSMGYTALHLAAVNQHLPVVKFLISAGLSPYQPSSLSSVQEGEAVKLGQQLSPLILAALHSQTDVVHYLIQQPECAMGIRNEATQVLHLSKYLSALTKLCNNDVTIQDATLTPPSDDATLVGQFQFVSRELSNHFHDCLPPEYIYHAMRIGCLLSSCGSFPQAETVWVSTIELHLKQLASCDCSTLVEVTRGVHYISCIVNQIQLYTGKISATPSNIPHFTKYVEYGVAQLEAMSQLQVTDMHILGYAEPVVVSILALFNLWNEVGLSRMNKNALASDHLRLAKTTVSLASDLLSGVTTPLHMVIHRTRTVKFHPYLVICSNASQIKAMVESICRWGGTHFLNAVDSTGSFPLSLINRSTYHFSYGLEGRVIADTLIMYGAHPDAFDRISSEKYVWNEPGILKLSCLCCHCIVQERLPYEKLSIPPRLKTLIGIHDYQKQLKTMSSATMLSKIYSIFSQISSYAMQTHYYRLH